MGGSFSDQSTVEEFQRQRHGNPCGAFIGMVCRPNSAEGRNVKRIEFDQLEIGETSPGPLDDIAVFIEYEPDQPASSGSLAFTLRIENKSAQSVMLNNPYDLLTYTLTNEEGWPISLPAPPSRLKIHYRGPFTNRKAHYMKITEITSDQEQKDIGAEVAKDIITVEAASTYVYELQIENVVAPEGQTKPTKIVAGKYDIDFILPLISATEGQQPGRVLESGNISIRVC